MAIDRATLSSLIDEWQEDARIDFVDLDRSSADIPVLHGKYVRKMAEVRPELRKLEIRRRKLVRILHEYYRGDLNDPSELGKLGRDPFSRRVIQSHVGTYVDGDSQLGALDEMIAWHQEYVNTCAEILRQIGTRHRHVGTAVEFRRATQFTDAT